MSTFAYSRIVIATLVAVAGCRSNNKFCDDHPGNNCDNPIVDAIDGPQACTSSAECAPQVCDVAGSMTCVQCTEAEDAACMGATPACVDNICAKCTEHGQCAASNVCLPDGSCANEPDVAYIAPTGSGTVCTKIVPCGTLDDGVKTNRTVVKFAPGVVKDNKTTTIDGKVVTILADPGAKLDRDGDGAILEVRSNNADVQIFDLEITGQTGLADSAISLVPNGGAPKLSLARVVVSASQGAGISASGGSLAVTQSTVTSNAGGGILMVANGVVTITNNFIHHNGNTVTASAGGLSLRPMGTSKVEFNTLIDNQANLGAASAGGVFCDTAGFVAANNLIFRNTGGTIGNVQTFGNCTYGNSFNMPGASAVDNSPNFADPNTPPFDYHLTAASPATVRDAAGTCTGDDFDREPRPVGGACDLGADEFKP